MSIVSENKKCNFYNVGYCKKSKKGCMFLHPKESCQSQKCEYKTCPYRHQKECKFFKLKNYCKHGSFCEFKHLEKELDAEEIIRDLDKSLEEARVKKD